MYIMDITADKKLFINADRFSMLDDRIYFYKDNKNFAVYNFDNIVGFAECDFGDEDYKWLRTKDTVSE